MVIKYQDKYKILKKNTMKCVETLTDLKHILIQ